MSTDGAIRVKGLSFPISPNPPSGKFYIGVDSGDGHFKKQDSSGAVVDYDASSSYTDEQAQDAVGNILADTATIDFTYNDGTPQITADVKDGSITDVKIATGIDGAKLQNLSVTNSKINDLDGAKLLALSVTDAKIASGIDGAKITNATITDSKIVDLDGAKLSAGSVTDAKLASGIDGGKLQNLSVTNAKINDLDGSKLSSASVTDAKIAAGVDAVKIGTGTVSNTEFGYLDGVTGALQTQINGKAATVHTHVSTDVTDFTEAAQDAVGNILVDTSTIDFTYNDAGNQISADVKDASITDVKIVAGVDAAKIGGGLVSNTEFGYLDGVSSAIQTQFSGKANTVHTHVSTDVTDFNEAAQDAVGNILTDTATIDFTYNDGGNAITADLKDNSVTGVKIVAAAVDDSKLSTGINANKIGSGSVDNTEFGYLDGVTSSIQAQITAKPSTAYVDAGDALRALKAGDTFTGAVNIKGDNVNTGYVNYEAQTSTPATPTSGFRMFANSLGKLAWKGTNGFMRIFDGTANTADRTYVLPDASVTLMADPMTTNGDLITRIASVAARLGIGSTGQTLKVLSGLPSWQNNAQHLFGDSNTSSTTLTGSFTATGPGYYNTLAINGAGSYNMAGYPVFCRTLDLSGASANALHSNGPNGASSTAGAGGAAGGAIAAAYFGGAGNGSAGGAGATNAGVQAAAPAAQNPSNGGSGGTGRAGGTATGAGGALRTGAATSNSFRFAAPTIAFLRNASSILGGGGGAGGGGGGGSGALTGFGGGAGGSGGGFSAIYCETLITDGSTALGAISCNGGNGGNSATATNANTSSGGGGGGGGGGYVFLVYASKTGSAVTGLIRCNGGAGGNSGNGNGTGGAGNAGDGGDSGYISVININTLTGTHVSTSAGSTGGTASGSTGATGGNGAVSQVTL
jgi:hypothetical protein